MSFLPLAHMFERCSIAASLMVGARIGFFGGNIKELNLEMEILAPTFLPSVPRLFNRIYDKVIAPMFILTLIKRSFLPPGPITSFWIQNQAISPSKRTGSERRRNQGGNFWISFHSLGQTNLQQSEGWNGRQSSIDCRRIRANFSRRSPFHAVCPVVHSTYHWWLHLTLANHLISFPCVTPPIGRFAKDTVKLSVCVLAHSHFLEIQKRVTWDLLWLARSSN